MRKATILYRLCMPREGVRTPSKEFLVLAKYLCPDEWAGELCERWSHQFTAEEAIEVLTEQLHLTREEARRRFLRLIHQRNIVGLYRPNGEHVEITIGEHATI